MENSKIIQLKSVYTKTQGQDFRITPCKNPKTHQYPDCVRPVDVNGQMILSESDKDRQSKGEVFIPEDRIFVIKHGTTFNLDIPAEKAAWEAIQFSSFIAQRRDERDNKGNYKIDGEKPHLDNRGNPVGRYGIADLYIDHPGEAAKSRNDFRKLKNQAENLILNDDLAHRVLICKLLEKDMSHSHPSDVEDYLMTLAGNQPQKVIELYTGTTTNIRLLLLKALEDHIVNRRGGLLIYADDVVLGGSMDAAVSFLANPMNLQVKNLIQRETFPELETQKKSKTPKTAE